MPRIVFASTDELKSWTGRFANPDKFTVYCTTRQEIILEPLRSTSPLRYGYVRYLDLNQFRQVLEWLRGQGFTVLKCRRYEWASDREVGARSPQEPEHEG